MTSADEMLAEAKVHFPALQKWRSGLQLSAFIAGEHPRQPRFWRQVMLEMERAYYALKSADIDQRCNRFKRSEFEKSDDPEASFEIERLDLAFEQTNAAIDGKRREVADLYEMFKSLPEFTYEEIEADERDYWIERITQQGVTGIISRATGIGVGDLDSMRQLGIPIEHVIEQVKPCLDKINASLGLPSNSGTSLLPSPDSSPADAKTSLSSNTASACVSANLARSSGTETASSAGAPSMAVPDSSTKPG